MTADAAERFPRIETAIWRRAVAPFQKSDLRLSLWQLVNSVCPFFVLWYLAYVSLGVSYLLTLAFAALAGMFAVRIFIIFHDACHGSFFKARWANDLTGLLTGIVVFTPYYNWRQTHAIHHATSGDLDRRGVGDIWTLTIEEYEKLPRWQQLGYRIYRNPIVMFGIGPIVDFVIIQRLPASHAAATPREKQSVHLTSLALLAIVIAMSFTIGFWSYVAVQLPVLLVATTMGVWLFYVQHQYENTYWEHHENWDFAQASLYGSSYYKLPRILQWFSGNIGFHHIHHLSPRIPNYKLEDCYRSDELFQRVEPLTLKTSLKSLFVRVWDEDRHKMIGYHKTEEPQARS